MTLCLCTFLWFPQLLGTKKANYPSMQSYDELTLIWCIVLCCFSFWDFFLHWQQSHSGQKFLTYCQSIHNNYFYSCWNTKTSSKYKEWVSPLFSLLPSTCICEFWFMVSISPASPQHIWNCIFWQPFWIRADSVVDATYNIKVGEGEPSRLLRSRTSLANQGFPILTKDTFV